MDKNIKNVNKRNERKWMRIKAKMVRRKWNKK